MNADLDEPIAQGSKKIDNVYHDGSTEDDVSEAEEEKSFLLPSRYWFASTAFPLTAGTFGPMANAFSICALVENWRTELPPGISQEQGIDIKDPKWLIAVNAISLTFALIANLSLLLNMARRVRFAVAQPITISGFYIASILLIALVAVASHHFQAPGVKDQALTQAYYYANFAAGLYFIIATLMCITVYGAHAGHYSKEFKLTVSQRTLMLQTISFMVYLLLGALIYHKIEGWKFLDALYWADFTCLTIGIGDFAPATHLGRGLLFPYAIGGIIILGLVVGSIRSLVLDRGKKKMSARMTEKTRKLVLRRIKAEEDSETGRTTITHKRKFGFGGATTFSLHPIESHQSNGEEAGDLTESSARHLERKRRIAEFHAMRYVQNLAAVERKWLSLLISGSAWFILWLIGALVFYKAEQEQNWSYFTGLYFAYTSLFTIGYGDLYPFSNSTKAFFVFWSLLAIPTLTILISNMGDTVIQAVKEITLYLGELTLLPGEKEDISYWDRVSYGVLKLTGGYIDLSPKQLKSALHKNQSSVRRNEAKKAHDKLSDVERDPSASNAASQPNQTPSHSTSNPSEDISHHSIPSLEDRPHLAHPTSHSHFLLLLLQEIKSVYTHHLHAQPSKLYSYEEWERFLHLIGEDETDAAFHRAPPVRVRKQQRRGGRSKTESGSNNDNQDHSEAGGKNGENEREDEEEEVSGPEGGSGEVLKGGVVGSENRQEKEKEKDKKWSWMGDRSPLMGEKDEAEWVIERLVDVLERELKTLHGKSKRDK